EKAAKTRTTTRKAGAGGTGTREPTAAKAKAADTKAATKADARARTAKAESSPAGTDQAAIPTLPGAAEMAAAAGPMTQKMLDNLHMAEDLIRRLSAALAQRGMPNPAIEAPGPTFYADAAQGWLRMLTEHPNRLIEQQVEF